MIERYIRQLEVALADTWRSLERDLYDAIAEAGISCALDDLRDKHRDAIDRAMEGVPEPLEELKP